MSFYIIYLFIILGFKAIFVESQYKESSFLYTKFCANLDVAHKYRNNKVWLNLHEQNKQPPTEDKNGAFAEWNYRYYSIKRFFDYCDFLKTAKDCDFSMQNKTMKQPKSSESNNQSACKCNISDCYEGTKFRHIALKPEFEYKKGAPMPIGDAMRNIVDAYQILYPGKFKKNLQKLLIKQNELPKMDFCNKEDCIKVDAWVYYAKQGISEKTVATPKLEEIQMHLLENVNKPLNLKEFPPQPPQPPQNKQQTADSALSAKPKTKQKKFSTSSSSSPRGHQYSCHTDCRRDNLYDFWMYSMMFNAMDDNRNSAYYSGTSGAGDDGCCFGGCDGGGCDGCDGGGCDGCDGCDGLDCDIGDFDCGDLDL